MPLPGFKFSSPQLSSLAISQREWREVAGSYGILNINNDVMDGGFLSCIRPVKSPEKTLVGEQSK